jgi:hypothetical protein
MVPMPPQRRPPQRRPPGAPLKPRTRASMETALGASFADVRVHDDAGAAALSRSIAADAFTHGSHIYLARPNPSTGLLAHELAHVVQQRAAPDAAGPLRVTPADDPTEREARAAAAAVEAGARFVPHLVAAALTVARQEATLAPQTREVAKLGWHIALDPPSGIVKAGTTVTFTLASESGEYVAWRPLPGAEHARPLFTLTDPSGKSSSWFPLIPSHPVVIARELAAPGHWRAQFRGKPVRAAGPAGQPWAMTLGGQEELDVRVDLDVVKSFVREEVDTAAVTATGRLDIAHLEDPKASDVEIVEAFKRLVVRRAIQVVNRNKQEAEDLRRLYTTGTPGHTAREHADDVARVLEFERTLTLEVERLAAHPELAVRAAEREGRPLSGATGIREYIAEKRERTQLARAALFEAFPAAALVQVGSSEFRKPFMTRPELRPAILQFRLGNVVKDCEATAEAIATGDLDVFDADLILAEMRETLGIDADARKKRAVDDAIRRHERGQMSDAMGLAGAALILLLVPGIGVFLSAAMGIAAAGIAWERVGDLATAAGAGARGGIVSREQVSTAAFWALFDTLAAALDVAQALGKVAKIAPHVAPTASRVAARSGRQVVRAGAGAAEGPLLVISDADLQELAARLLRRPVPDLATKVKVYATLDEFKDALRVVGEAGGAVPTAFYDESTGVIHLGPQAGLVTALHEVVHKVAREMLPHRGFLFGEFLEEGITEAITRAAAGPRAGHHGYDLNVLFVDRLATALGSTDVVLNALLHGEYPAFRSAIKRALGGSEAATFEWFTKVRSVAGLPDAAGRRALTEAMEMLEGARPAATGAPLPPLVPPKGVVGGYEAWPARSQAALKLLATEFGRDLASRAERVLNALADRLGKLRDRLALLAGDARLGEETRGVIEGARNAIDDHLAPDDLTGALRDELGRPVRMRGSGEAKWHITEVQNGRNALARARAQILRELNRRVRGTAEFTRLSREADTVNETIRLINEFLALRP